MSDFCMRKYFYFNPVPVLKYADFIFNQKEIQNQRSKYCKYNAKVIDECSSSDISYNFNLTQNIAFES